MQTPITCTYTLHMKFESNTVGYVLVVIFEASYTCITSLKINIETLSTSQNLAISLCGIFLKYE